MQRVSGWLIFLCGSATSVCAQSVPRARTPILVELFTSEGCSSCPPADALLASLDQRQPIPDTDLIVLGEHVDYWDQTGWKDRFSSSEFTDRQRDYQLRFHLEDIYTPQAVVNGAAQFNGADRQGIESAVARASSLHSADLRVTSVQIRGGAIAFTLQNTASAALEGFDIYAALVEPAATTRVLAGENQGRTLRHAGVVRVLARLGTEHANKPPGDHPYVFQTHQSGDLSALRLVVFLQPRHFGPIAATTACALSPGAVSAAYRLCPAG
jgi:hypothetical protein